ncbi:MAG: polymerase subunit beta [Candidatus Midichloriaceae bacterium]|jgi:predicted nucleotidyltransferase|nr:polymerase subunit beta [Candidatus Midichloriaceae bacterium]
MYTNIHPLDKYNFLKQLSQLSFIEKIILFGSRARGDNYDRSDIDLAIVCPKASSNDWLKVLEVIDSADTLLKIDCVRLDDLPKKSELRENIMKEGKVIYISQMKS